MDKKETSIIRSSAAEYLTFLTATGESNVNAVYADENVWLTQKMMGVLYGVETHTVNYHLKKIFQDRELEEDSVIRKFRITASDGKQYLTMWDREVLQDAGKISAAMAKIHAETEFEKYRIVQDRLYTSDFDCFLLEHNEEVLE